jgi:N-acetylmuramoyl-L-alanine amidase
MLTADSVTRYPTIILDCGHGTGPKDTGAVARGRREVDVVREVVAHARDYLAVLRCAVVVLSSGSYASRQADPRALTADLWVSVHCDVQASKRPYTLGLGRKDTTDLARRLATEFGGFAEVDRVESGEAGSSLWPRGLVCFGSAPCPAVLLELGSLAHSEHDRLWLRADITGRALAEACAAMVGR